MSISPHSIFFGGMYFWVCPQNFRSPKDVTYTDSAKNLFYLSQWDVPDPSSTSIVFHVSCTVE